MENIAIATLGDSNSIKMGTEVVAIGNALGYGQSVTNGIISALDRSITMQNANGATVTNKFIQTNAAINAGNSGGALLNMAGEVIGINSAKIESTGVEGMGYAIPISDVEELIENLMTMKTRTEVDEADRGYIGIKGADVTSSVSKMYGMPVGVFVSEITKDSPAEKAGLKEEDVIVKFDSTTVSSMSDLQGRLAYYKKGEKVTITVQRPNGNDFEELELEITLGSKESAGIDE
jgi:serine protease Do